MIDTAIEWFFVSIVWLARHWYLLLGGLVVFGILEHFFPCLFKHDWQKKIENFYESTNVRSYTLAFECSRCGKRYHS